MTVTSFSRERIQEQWMKCRIEGNPASISTFGYKDISEIDIDGYWFKERDSKSKSKLSGSQSSLEPMVVLFPGQQQVIDPSSRPQWYFRRALFRRTSSTYSFADLDSAFSELAPTQFSAPRSEAEEECIVNRTSDLLSRLPVTPLPLPALPLPPEDKEKQGWLKVGGDKYLWEDLEVVYMMSVSVIRMALAIAVTWDRSLETNIVSKELHRFRKFLNSVSELIDSTSYESGKLSPQYEWQAWRWFVLKAYLWSTWQRCVALHYWRILQDHLVIGFDYNDLSELALRPNMDSSLASEQQTALKSEYMCSLAYQILHRSRSTALLDLRQFHSRFNDLFGKNPGRCNNGQSCNGKSPIHCRRIQGATVVNQSQHDLLCLDPTECSRILWDESSYRQVTGARAVSISDSLDGTKQSLRYENASQKTLAISHVWSHGQGGRPESGLNTCLHRRYCRIARSFGCLSYWIDAACIPGSHELRTEAIMTINSVFLKSHAVLLCDRDLMGVDISVIQSAYDLSSAAVSLRESILSTILVCDWNVRAWTLLEALRGRKNIYILCRSGKVISLREILQVVSTHGSINIGILLLTNYHLFPAPKSLDWLTRHTDGRSALSMARVKQLQLRKIFNVSYDASLIASRIDQGFLAISEAATLLAQRYASRPGDDVIIWSLLVGDDPFKDALQLWMRGRHGLDLIATDQTVYTGFLLSSVPRLPPPGPSWAPCQPGPNTSSNNQQTNHYPPYDGNLSQIGTIEFDDGICLRAVWGVSSIIYQRGLATSYDFRPPHAEIMLHSVVSDCLESFNEGILLQPLQEVEPDQVEGNEGGAGAATVLASVYKGPSQGPLFAICGRRDSKNGPWTWLGVLDWGVSGQLPYFAVREVLLK